ncbi:Gti1/Pac2 family-domain-containing protein [Dichotomocladium elegans]|nr:Gti1/Pac2 family-domain-containing protein [Dichotomocladium elegans]
MLVTETFHGYIETTQDVLLIFEGCRRGLLPRISRRLQEKERKMIQSGSVFVFDERESGIKRWTDGYVWSPSRILGNFLIYRELDKRSPSKRGSFSSAPLASAGEGNISSTNNRQRSYSADQSSVGSAAGAIGAAGRHQQLDRRLVGSLSDSYKFRKNGLIKKTMSIVVNGVSQHLISYYTPQDVMNNRLRTPSSVPELASLEISLELLARQNFRIPPMIEPTFDSIGTRVGTGPDGCNPLGTGDGSGDGSSSTYTYNDRRSSHQSLRSMSLSSFRGPDPHHHPYHSTARPPPPLDPTALMWHPTEQPKLPYGAMYNSDGQQPSPVAKTASSSSSPDSPAPSYIAHHQERLHHQEHYSASSNPSPSSDIHITDQYNRPYSSPLQHHQQLEQRPPPPNDYMVNLYQHQHKGIDQLLNPIHPLNAPSPSSSQHQHHPQQSFYSAADPASNSLHVARDTAGSLAGPIPQQQPAQQDPRQLTDAFRMIQHHHHHTPSHTVISPFHAHQDGQDMAGPLILK